MCIMKIPNIYVDKYLLTFRFDPFPLKTGDGLLSYLIAQFIVLHQTTYFWVCPPSTVL